jgi:hypothetical protein
VLHRYIAEGRIGELPDVCHQLLYLVLTPFLGKHQAAEAALKQQRVPAPQRRRAASA